MDSLASRSVACVARFLGLACLAGLSSAQTSYRINAGGDSFMDPQGNFWDTDAGFVNTGNVFWTFDSIAGTDSELLYQSERWDHPDAPEMAYVFPVSPGTYRVRLHFAEIYFSLPGERAFDVEIEGQPVLTAYDIAAVAGPNVAVVEEFQVLVTDGALEIDFIHVVENPKVSAVEVELVLGPQLGTTPAALDFGPTLVGGSTPLLLTLSSVGEDPLVVDSILLTGADPASFAVAPASLPLTLAPGEDAVLEVTFLPTTRTVSLANLILASNDLEGSVIVPLRGTGILPAILMVQPAALDLGTVTVSDVSAPHLLTLTNDGDLPLFLTDISFAGEAAAEFGLTAGSTGTVLAGESTELGIAFAPLRVGERLAQLHLESNDAGSPTVIPLTGTGELRLRNTTQVQALGGPVLLAVDELDFGTVEVGASAQRTLLLRNDGKLPVQVIAILLTGQDPAEFSASTSWPVSVPPKGVRGIPVFFSPQEAGPQTAQARVVSNSLGPDVSIAFTGEGFVPAPVAEFVGSPTSGAAPLSVTFTDQSTGDVTSHAWDFGDGGTSVLASPEHTYTTPGLYTVALTVTGPGGSDLRTRTDYIDVAVPAPVAEFVGSPNSGAAPLSVTFADQSTGNVTSHAWDFGDGGTSVLASPEHTYTTPGLYTVALTVTGPGGSDLRTRTDYIDVAVPAPVAEFVGSPNSGAAPLSVTFADQSTGNVTSHAWDFGDGGTSVLASPEHTYTTPGLYTVALTVTGPGGSDLRTRTDYIDVAVPAPVAEFVGSPTSGAAPLSVTFTDQSTGDVTSHAWDFGDGGTSVLASPEHTYTTTGLYTVALTVTGPGGSDLRTRTDYIDVAVPAPVAEFVGSPTSGAAPLSVTFADQSTGDVTSHAWDFGDGGTSVLASPEHTYTTTGLYTVALTVTGPGGSDLRTRTDYIDVAVPAPVAEFVGSPTSGAAPLSVTFADQSTGNVTSHAWNFGDGGTSALASPEHTYTTPGLYTVALTVTGPGGSDLRTRTDYIDVAVPAPHRIFIPAASALSAIFTGEMTTSADYTAGNDLDPARDSLFPALVFANGTVNDFSGTSGSQVQYQLDLPESDEWFLWGRFYYPGALASNDANSFSCSVDGGTPLKFGNNKDFFQTWHWDGNGTIESGPVAALSLGNLSAGVHFLSVSKREVVPIPPRLDVLLLTNDPTLVPTDAEALAGLFPAALVSDVGTLAWGHVLVSTAGSVQSITLSNPGTIAAHITELTFRILQGVGHDFWVDLEGTPYTGDQVDLTHPVNVSVPGGGSLIVPIQFLPTENENNEVVLEFGGNFQSFSVDLLGEGVPTSTGDPFLHVVIGAPALQVDHDGDGSEAIALQGQFSHTHEIGHALTSFEWSEGGMPFSSEVNPSAPFAVGEHTVTLTIADDNVPPRTLSDSATFRVVDIDDVPGALVLYYPTNPKNLLLLLDSLPVNADFGEISEAVRVEDQAGQIGMTPLANDVLVQLVFQVDLETTGPYEFQVMGGSASRLFVDGIPTVEPVQLAAGRHAVEARFAVGTLADLPVEVTLTPPGGSPQTIDPAQITHDESTLVPVVNSAPTGGLDSGGNPVRIEGIGFFPSGQVSVHWGGTILAGAQLSLVSPDAVELVAPAGQGEVTVLVETPNGLSDHFVYVYSPTGPVPIQFGVSTLASLANPTQADWGPDGRLYVASITGTITAFTFDDDYAVTDVQVISTLESAGNVNILGIAFSAFDAPDPVRVYVAHGLLFANGGACLGGDCDTAFSAYSGQISRLTGPDFIAAETLISGLPVSNHDHGINGLQFDNDGALLISVGGNTNAGVIHCNIGELPESPLSGAILRAPIYAPGFSGEIHYFETTTGLPNDNQVCGDRVDPASGVDIAVYASGMRNSFDLTLATRGRIYATDNGPNLGFGAASTGPTSEAPDPFHQDELLLVEEDGYYGHPNRNRGRTDARENVYHGTIEPSVPGVFTQELAAFPSSTNGIVEYRARTFNGALRGELLAQKWNGPTYRVRLAPNGRSVASLGTLPASLDSLDVLTGPGGAVLGASYSGSALVIARPIDVGAVGLTVYDVFPWRAHQIGGEPFVIGGVNFGDLSNTTVTIGGQPATLTSVSSTRIRGIVPTSPDATSELLDITVSVGGQSRVLPAAFRYLYDPGLEPVHDAWESAPALPLSLGEVAGGVIDGKLYVFGQGSSATLAYDLAASTWDSPGALATRPFSGHHHAAEVVGGRLYLIGGLGGGSEGRVQIYDPASDAWTDGTNMAWSGGSLSTAAIGGKIYAAGGIVSTSTVSNHAVYDPATDAWTSLAPMPVGRNHAAAGTNGTKMFVFGGRGPGSGDGNVVANGFADVQIYDPGSDTWEWSGAFGSTLVPLPQARGGMGRAVYFGGEFYVLGGETSTGAGATPQGVYARVDVYDPSSNTWHLAAPMPTARHGIFPLIHGGKLHLAGGGANAGFSQSSVFEVYTP